ncbi:YbaB/EbfC family nucleoid-associated protein [Nocardia sp. NBC_00881]|uniref:YbaB/EbfC family nucleoid-associated protein n=1 Tax=Nocardia sp. NBC_00881 TaxID=2975995 RepID=UPI00386A4F42|nr:YbaB/EbfC family nucleoid-associated protein [Nocardia sp. NBC_00881]
MARLADLLDTVQAGMKSIDKMQQQRVLLTGVGTAANNRVKVTVNADGAVIETKLTGDIHKLTYDQIGNAVTAAAQDAIAEMRRKTAELMQPLQEHNPLVPKLSELTPGAPDIFDLIPKPPEASLAPPDSPDWKAADAAEFTDVEQQRSVSRSRVADLSGSQAQVVADAAEFTDVEQRPDVSRSRVAD